jgi:hypothetical protein
MEGRHKDHTIFWTAQPESSASHKLPSTRQEKSPTWAIRVLYLCSSSCLMFHWDLKLKFTYLFEFPTCPRLGVVTTYKDYIRTWIHQGPADTVISYLTLHIILLFNASTHKKENVLLLPAEEPQQCSRPAAHRRCWLWQSRHHHRLRVWCGPCHHAGVLKPPI